MFCGSKRSKKQEEASDLYDLHDPAVKVDAHEHAGDLCDREGQPYKIQIPRKRQKDRNFEIHRDEERMHQAIRGQTWPMICLNDTELLDEKEFQRLQKKLKADFDCILKESGKYEN